MAAAAPGWVMLERIILKNSGSSAADAKTTVAACTSSGQPFSVSLCIAAPPEVSRFHYDLVAGAAGEGSTPSSDTIAADRDHSNKDLQLRIIAAHDDSVLIESPVPRQGYSSRANSEYFLYDAAAAAAAGADRMPSTSLFLLPGCYVSYEFERDKEARHVLTRSTEARHLSFGETSILRCRGDGVVLVAQLEIGYEVLPSTAELCVLRPGHDWVVKRLPIIHDEGKGDLIQMQQRLRFPTEIDAAVPVGSCFMCWVDYTSGFILCDMAEEENPKQQLRFVPLPVSLPADMGYLDRRPQMEYCRKLAGASPSAVRFVSVAPRCCCGGPGKTTCERSSFAFNVTTWTLRLSTDEPMAWVKDGVLDCDELWQLPNYGRLPCVAPRYPIVSSDDPDIVCFTICERDYFIDGADDTVWMVEINTRSKALLRVVSTDRLSYIDYSDFLPAKLHWLQ